MRLHTLRIVLLTACAAVLGGAAAHALTADRIVLAICFCPVALVSLRLQRMSPFLRIVFSIFAIEALLLSLTLSLPVLGVNIPLVKDLGLGVTHAVALALFAVATLPISRIPLFNRIFSIGDRYVVATERFSFARLGPIHLSLTEKTFFVLVVTITILVGQLESALLVWAAKIGGKVTTALRDMDAATFWPLVTLWLPGIAIGKLLLSFFAALLKQTLDMRWSRFVAKDLIGRWLGDGRQYRLALSDRSIDNPDQRIHEDVGSLFSCTRQMSPYGYVLTSAREMTALVTVTVILWTLSDNLGASTFGVEVPGLLVWVVLLWTALPAYGLYLLSKPLAPLTVKQQVASADFRFGLSRMREYAEQIALMKGDRAEMALGRKRLMHATRREYITDIYETLVMSANMSNVQLAAVSSSFVVAPFYFAGVMTIGQFTEVAGYFTRANLLASMFVDSFQNIALMRAYEARISGLLGALDQINQAKTPSPISPVSGDGIALRNVELYLPDGRRLSQPLSLDFAPGENVLVMGPSGAGKSTLMRALCGIWPFRTGLVQLPEGARMLALPQSPYLPMGPLAAALAYPAQPAMYDKDEMRQALIDAELPQLVAHLDDQEESWGSGLSGGERQRLSLARALLAQPQWLLLDEATSAMDGALEARMYALLLRRLPQTSISSVGHRDSLVVHHQRRLIAVADADRGCSFIAQQGAILADTEASRPRHGPR